MQQAIVLLLEPEDLYCGCGSQKAIESNGLVLGGQLPAALATCTGCKRKDYVRLTAIKATLNNGAVNLIGAP